MSYSAGARYREMEILALPPARRLVAVFAHLVVTLRRARVHIEQGEIEARANRIVQAQDIIQELIVTLDRKAGGALAERLLEIYNWMFTELLAVNVRPNVARLAVVAQIATDLHAAWSAAADQAEPAAATVS